MLAGLAAAARLGNQFIVSAAGIERQLSQADKFGGLAEESVGVHDGWRYDLRIDTARHTPDQAAKLLVLSRASHCELRDLEWSAVVGPAERSSVSVVVVDEGEDAFGEFVD